MQTPPDTRPDGVGRPPAGVSASAFSPFPDRIDRYRIIRRLGEGGMGTVYLAEQDEPVRREVALKVLKPGLDSAEVIARFGSERQALALMEHPNITHVYDAGLTPAGLPYFVMELVTGEPVDVYAANHRLSTRQRVEMLVQLCRAVQHAHQKGIIHRDIKPSNVLVTEVDGRPVCKVIDFGIAMATGATASSLRLTATGVTVGTPAYMSPEQFLSSGLDIDTRTDIYSLGVMLYELLAGVLPGGSEDTPTWGTLMRRAEGDFPSPSAQFAALGEATRAAYAAERNTDPATLRRLLHGDLDCILLKALDPDRERRYSTAAALASDLEHYLNDEPVNARPASRAYRMRKFARRHRAGVVLSAVLVLVLIATTIGASVQARRLAVARTIAVSRQQQAEQLTRFMLVDFTAKLRPIGRLDVLDDVAREVLATFARTPDASLSDAEVVRRVEALQQLGELRTEQARYAEADTLMRRAVTLAAPLAARDSANAEVQLALAHAEYGVGMVARQLGRPEDALRHLTPFVEISRRLAVQFPDSLEFHAQRAYALNNLGQASEGLGDVHGATRDYDSARVILSGLIARDSSKVEWQVALGAVLNATGAAQLKLGDLTGARANHEAELAWRERLLARDTSDATQQRNVGIAHVYLANAQLWRGSPDSALAQLAAARVIYASLVKRDSANATGRLILANCDRRIAQALLESGDVRGALVALARSRAGLRLLMSPTPNERAARELAVVNMTEARVLLAAGRSADARRMAQLAVANGDSAVSTRPTDRERRKQAGIAYLVLGEASARAGDRTAATQAWSRAITLTDAPAASREETEVLALRTLAERRLGRDVTAREGAAELTRRGVRLPTLLAALRDAERAPSR